MNLLNPKLDVQIRGIIYRLRFLGLYIIIGFFSILLEFLIRDNLIKINISQDVSTVFGIICGIFFAFFCNVKFNFKIPKARRNRALAYFFIISAFSAILQLLFKKKLSLQHFPYEINRLLISSLFFAVAYLLHRKYSFSDFKKVGVAIYANGVEDFNHIHNLIGQYPDFIHVDIVDDSMSNNAEEVKTFRLETIKAYWPNTQVQTHIMSKNPSRWLNQIITYSDVIYLHAECDENILETFEQIRKEGRTPGLALLLSTDPNDIIDILKKADYVLLLTVANSGSSGQKFDFKGLELIKKLNDLPFRNKFTLCVDGGINEHIVNLLEAENIVSGSSVLENSDPKKQIMRLQTVGRYES